MPSALDVRIETTIAAITGPDGPLPTSTTAIDGVTMPIIQTPLTTLAMYFAHFIAQHGDATFLVDGEERLSFTQVYAAATRVAHALVRDHGVRVGDRVGIAMRNAPAWIVLYMGIIMAGGVATLLNGWWQGGELADGIDEVGATIVFADPPRAQRLQESGRALAARVVTVDIAQRLDSAIAPVIADDAPASLPTLDADDLATILFTSGSTGQSKGAYSTHRAVLQAVLNYLVTSLALLQVMTEDGQSSELQPSTLLNVPLFHVTAEVPVMLQSFAIGRKLVLMPKWDARHAMQLIEQERITYFVGVPLMSFEILNHPERASFDLTSCTAYAAGGAPRPVEHVRRIDAEMGNGKPLLGYGLTETNAIGCGTFGENYLAKPSSTGRASAPLVDLAILDDQGRAVAQGGRGEVCIRTVANFSGYWNRPDATAAAFTADRYFRTGDIGYLDVDGYLFIVDRKKDIIIRGGENISCQEVEDALYRHPAVAEACVFGLDDARLGEVPGAVVYYHPGNAVDASEMTAFLYHEIAAFKVPAQIWTSEAPLPRLGTEKIDKVVLRNAYRAKLGEAA